MNARQRRTEQRKWNRWHEDLRAGRVRVEPSRVVRAEVDPSVHDVLKNAYLKELGL